MVNQKILEKLDELPESLQTQVLHYIDSLLDTYKQSDKSSQLGDYEEAPKKFYGYGNLPSKVNIADDVDDIMEDLKG